MVFHKPLNKLKCPSSESYKLPSVIYYTTAGQIQQHSTCKFIHLWLTGLPGRGSLVTSPRLRQDSLFVVCVIRLQIVQ